MNHETVSPERLAMLIHHYSEVLAPDFGLRPSASSEWGDLSQEERHHIIAATRLALLDVRAPNLKGKVEEMPSFASVGADGSEGKECGC
jgi:hypothetical protein